MYENFFSGEPNQKLKKFDRIIENQEKFLKASKSTPDDTICFLFIFFPSTGMSHNIFKVIFLSSFGCTNNWKILYSVVLFVMWVLS